MPSKPGMFTSTNTSSAAREAHDGEGLAPRGRDTDDLEARRCRHHSAKNVPEQLAVVDD